jgi:TonB family protein
MSRTEEPLFTDLPLSGSAKPPHDRRKFIGSVVIHTAAVTALVIIPLLSHEELPDTTDPLRILIFNPPPAAAISMLKGSEFGKKEEAPKKVAEKPVEKPKEPEVKPEFVAPKETPKEVVKEERVAAADQFGSETGSNLGNIQGLEGGIDAGQVGGIVGGDPNGCVGCTGDGPVMDFDRPPKILKQTQPRFSQEAFVKKIEGVVLVQLTIDADGRVVAARVLRSIPALDAQAISCVKEWIFSPAIKNGRPVKTVANANVTFRVF